MENLYDRQELLSQIDSAFYEIFVSALQLRLSEAGQDFAVEEIFTDLDSLIADVEADNERLNQAFTSSYSTYLVINNSQKIQQLVDELKLEYLDYNVELGMDQVELYKSFLRELEILISQNHEVVILEYQNTREAIDELANKRISLFHQLVMFCAFMLLFIIAVILVVYRTVQAALNNLVSGAQRIAAGNYGQKIVYTHNDELRDLVKAFNMMSQKIADEKNNLEKKVSERTEEARAKVDEYRELSEKNAMMQKATLNILEDVQETEKQVEKEKEQFQSTLESIGDGAFSINKAGRVIFVNKQAQKMVGYSEEHIIGQPFDRVFRFISERTRQSNNAFVDSALRQGKIAHMTNHTVLVQRSGNELPISNSAAPIFGHSGAVEGCVVVFRDVSFERKVDKMKSDFLTIASHQMRTPLTSIRWGAEMLQEDTKVQASKEASEVVSDIDISAKRLIDMVNIFMNISQLESGSIALSPENFVVSELLDDVVERFQKQQVDQGIQILTDYDPQINELPLDKFFFSQVINNYIENAINYRGEKDCRIVVSTRLVDGFVRVAVSDNGMGIMQKDKAKLFTRFFRSDKAVKRHTDGNGLGLYFVKVVADSFSGRVGCDSTVGEGSTFYFDIPPQGMMNK